MLHHHLLDWSFPDKYSPTKGLSVRRFKFHFKDLTNPLKNLLEPSQDLINTESGEEETTTVPTTHDFNPNYKGIDNNIKNYKNTPMTYYIKESYFLYDKSDLIKDTFITALNKKISIYGSMSYFNKKLENEIFKIVSPEELLKFYVDKDVTKNSLSFQLTSISGNIPVLKDKKIHNLSLTRIGEKRKRIMAEPVETVIIHA